MTEINKCIDPKKKHKKKNLNFNSNHKFTLLQGLYGGEKSTNYMNKNFTNNTFSSKKNLFKNLYNYLKRAKTFS